MRGMTGRTKTSSHQGPFRWNNTRQNIIRLLQEFYILRVSDILFIVGQESDDKRRNVQYVLSRLRERGFVGRLRFFDDLAETASITYAYFLTDKGADALEDPTAAFTKESQLIPRHEVEITQFHIYLKRWTDKQGFNLHWHQPKMDHKKDINPDAYFGIEDPKLPTGKNTLHYFLEMERSPLGNYRNGEPSIIRKLAKYYELYDSTDCERHWGFRKFRVITVVRNADKQYNLCRRLSERYSHRMFWVTAESMFRDNIGGEVFKTPKDFSKSAYSFLSQ
jgi:hypothetical protein